MILASGLLTQFIHIALVLVAAPFVTGLIRWTKARLLGRFGQSPFQPWRDLMRLARKQPVLAENASFVFRRAPVVIFVTTAAAALLIPSFALGMITGPAADLLVIAGLLTWARCILALAGMDIGTAFGGIGASREMAYAAFTEPALLLVFFTVAFIAGTTNLDLLVELLRDDSARLRVSLGLALIATAAVAIAENGRIPVDNPATHLELTMVHEAMLLEYSGRNLALLDLAAALKLLLWFNMLGAIYLPFGFAPPGLHLLDWIIGIAAWAAKLIGLSMAVAGLEISLAKMRVFRVPEFLGIAVLLGLLALIFLFVSQGMV
ncbi:MAG: NADH-quinone oxidoreductase subunit H [Acetobacteraceae bacterium]|nr:NADH-quinone oxidoreductase subunit H [Acetobacteraceae bacterium]MBV8522431.1 NADH-quinone oxidoreductase subunit H [Acetobacteraceae bacterium]MBV8588791.1 NADH-quinone oxidoreductase subunit H [Acetobacteraceae bacterium]